jgi:hypothetical protein
MVAMRRLAMVLCGVLAFAVGCAPANAAREHEVQARIEAFLEALRTGREASGWNLLQDDVRAAYPGGAEAWIQAVRLGDPGGLSWTILDVTVDDFVGCANVDFGRSRDKVPFTLYDDGLPAMARIAASLSAGPFYICATVGPLPWDAGVHGVG